MKWLMFSVSSLLVVTIFGQQDPPDPLASATVTIAQGTVTGSKASAGDYYEFYGIPYADSTSGEHRFKAPRDPPSFKDVFIANRKDIKCVRALKNGYEGTEDCLVANVFTPSTSNTENLPVMVWIKGREFDKEYDPSFSFKHFMDKKVIVVSLNYRESVLGFLCLGTETAPGNAGLKDIIAGLKWVKTNIAQFGGNPDQITLFGHGSGGAAVDLITLSPMANGLIHRAIAQSGNAVAPWAVSRDNLKHAIQVAEALGHIVINIEQLSDVFSRTSVAALMGVINELDLTDNALAFGPCVERQDLANVEPFLIKSPSEILDSGEFMKIPFIIGYVDNEGSIRAREALEGDWLQRMNTEFENFIQADLKFETDDERSKVAEQIRQFYFQNEDIQVSNIKKYVEYQSETMILVSSIRDVRARAQTSEHNYLYQFSYKGKLGEIFSRPVALESAAHSEELAYLFYNEPQEPQPSDADLNVARILIERWTNFAKTGVPRSETSNVDWLPFTKDNAYYLRFLTVDEMMNIEDAPLEISFMSPHSNTLPFWDEIYSKYFQDAESNWILDVRDEDEDSPTPAPDGGDSGDESVTTEEPVEDPASPAPDGDTVTTEAPSSASSVVSYTFLIMSLFTILDKFFLSTSVS